MGLHGVYLTVECNPHGALRTLYHRPRFNTPLLAQAGELAKAGLEHRGHASQIIPPFGELFIELHQVDTRPETFFKGLCILLGRFQKHPLLENDVPGNHGGGKQQQHHQLDHDAGPGKQ